MLVTVMLTTFGEIGYMVTIWIVNRVEGVIPNDWHSSIIVNCYKSKGVALDNSNYRRINLQCMKFMKSHGTNNPWHINLDIMQFGFNPSRGITDAINLNETTREVLG